MSCMSKKCGLKENKEKRTSERKKERENEKKEVTKKKE